MNLSAEAYYPCRQRNVDNHRGNDHRGNDHRGNDHRRGALREAHFYCTNDHRMRRSCRRLQSLQLFHAVSSACKPVIVWERSPRG